MTANQTLALMNSSFQFQLFSFHYNLFPSDCRLRSQRLLIWFSPKHHLVELNPVNIHWGEHINHLRASLSHAAWALTAASVYTVSITYECVCTSNPLMASFSLWLGVFQGIIMLKFIRAHRLRWKYTEAVLTVHPLWVTPTVDIYQSMLECHQGIWKGNVPLMGGLHTLMPTSRSESCVFGLLKCGFQHFNLYRRFFFPPHTTDLPSSAPAEKHHICVDPFRNRRKCLSRDICWEMNRVKHEDVAAVTSPSALLI